MTFGYHLLAWRRHRAMTQADLASKTGLTRPYLSRLEMDRVDPSLSLLRRLSTALNLTVGELIQELPDTKQLTNEELDKTARGALKPDGSNGRYARSLSRLLKERRASLGLYHPRAKTAPAGLHVQRRLRADLGETQWQALLKRIDKHATFLAPQENEDK